MRDAYRVNTEAPIYITAAIAERDLFDNSVETPSKIMFITTSVAKLDAERMFKTFGCYTATKTMAEAGAMILQKEFLDYPKLNNVQFFYCYPGIVNTDMQRGMRERDTGIQDADYRRKIEVPDYVEGEDWTAEDKLPTGPSQLRTVEADFSARFILWAANQPPRDRLDPKKEYNFYGDHEFHKEEGRLQPVEAAAPAP